MAYRVEFKSGGKSVATHNYTTEETPQVVADWLMDEHHEVVVNQIPVFYGTLEEYLDAEYEAYREDREAVLADINQF